VTAVPENDAMQILARYRARYRRQDRLFTLLNALLGIFIRPRRRLTPKEPRRILVANAGHLGDIIISTALFPVLKSAFPNATIDFLTGTYSRQVVVGHPSLSRVFLYDHWRSERSGQSLLRRIAKYYLRMPSVCRELRARQYDIALDVHAWHPNYVLLFWLARIPIRTGCGRVGYAPTLTHPVPFRYDRRRELEHQLDVVRALGVGARHIALAQPNLAPIPAESRVKARVLLSSPANTGRYHVLHLAASIATRDWVPEAWADLARHLAAEGIAPVITGLGERALATAQVICAREPRAISTIDKLSWNELMAVLESADLIYSVETSAGHAARALGRPVVAIYGGMGDPRRWAPLGSTVATHAVSCSPCFNKHGCASRDCLTKLRVDEVRLAADTALSLPTPDHLEPQGGPTDYGGPR
jgi:ADP-heptose:LPS heptosyltransferase